ncbi:hypothetical protein GN244_ATG09926 [Phytophthora infestans]|uniref:Uncharacterized protein n=1 Tax=Phytophthora infestans TaxID=4787 RepID=A0A833SQF5_PHYIN|nr:hypothetical protein GN244_ATG09926 [Phytophthora infestans]
MLSPIRGRLNSNDLDSPQAMPRLLVKNENTAAQGRDGGYPSAEAAWEHKVAAALREQDENTKRNRSAVNGRRAKDGC